MRLTAHAIARSLAVVALAAMAVVLAVTPAVAAGPASTPLSLATSVTPSGTVGYDMSGTMPSIGMSGCMVCHGDSTLARIKNGKLVSYYINPDMVLNSAHKSVLCTGCHIDFMNKAPHVKAGVDWRAQAKQVCKDCHKKEYDEYAQSVHAQQVRPGVKAVKLKPGQKLPECGDCHGGHGMEMLTKNEPARARLRANGFKICGPCHKDAWGSYSDYYHGAAYKSGAPDAPACWTCHGAHLVLPKKDPRSTVNPDNIKTTCGQCHDGVDQGYINYSGAIHGKRAAIEANPIYAFVHRATAGLAATVTGIIGTMRSWFGA